MTSVRSIFFTLTLVTSVALAGSVQAGNPGSEQVEIGTLWGALEYCKAKHAKGDPEKSEYQKSVTDLKKKLRQMSSVQKHQVFAAKKSTHKSGTYEGRALDPQECVKLRKTAVLASQKAEPADEAKQEKTLDESQ